MIAILPNQSLQPTARWRCASMSILIAVAELLLVRCNGAKKGPALLSSL